MAKRVTLKWFEEYPVITGGLYRLWVGKKYYIGRSIMLLRRFSEHRKAINRRLQSDYKMHPMDYYQKIIKHILSSRGVGVLYLEILVSCSDQNRLIRLEQKWFNKCQKDKNCLNLGFISDTRNTVKKKLKCSQNRIK